MMSEASCTPTGLAACGLQGLAELKGECARKQLGGGVRAARVSAAGTDSGAFFAEAEELSPCRSLCSSLLGWLF